MPTEKDLLDKVESCIQELSTDWHEKYTKRGKGTDTYRLYTKA